MSVKILLLSILLIGFIFTASGCSQSSQIKTTETKIENPVNIATPMLVNNLKSALNNGWEIVDTNKIYVTKSNDFQNAYFVGTLIRNSSQIYNCIWFTNSDTMSGDVNSANDYAIQATSLPDARKSQVGVNVYDDGYSRINSKLLADWNMLNK